MTPVTGGGLICEDDVGCSRALRAMLRRKGFGIVATVSSADELLAAAAHAEARVILLDLALAGLAGLRIITPLRNLVPGAAVVVLSPFVNLRSAAMEAGAYDLVDLRDPRELERCLERVMAESETRTGGVGHRAGNGHG